MPDSASPVRIACLDSSQPLLSPMFTAQRESLTDVVGDGWSYWESFWVPLQSASKNREYVDCRDFQPDLGPGKDEVFASAVEDPQVPQEFDPQLQVKNSHDWSLHKAQAYSRVYEGNIWGGEVSRSGPGSDPFHPMV